MALLSVLLSCTNSEVIEGNKGAYDSEINLYVIDDDVLYEDDSNTGNKEVDDKISKNLVNYSIKMLREYSYASKENVVVSPYSASLVHSLMSNFAADKKQNSYKKEIGLDEFENKDINSFWKKTIEKEKNKNSDNEVLPHGNVVQVFNRLWMNEKSSVYKSFLTLSNQYNVNVQGINMNDKNSLNEVNNSIYSDMSDKNAYIKDADWKGVNSAVSSYVKFVQSWKDVFDKDSTKNISFKDISYNYTNCAAVCDRRIMKYGEFDNFSLFEIPYSDMEYSMFIVLPHSIDRIFQALQDIQDIGLDNCIKTMSKYDVNLTLPKFSCYFNTSLKQLRDSDNIDKKLYSTLLPSVSPSSYRLDDVFQICTISIDEFGTEATSVSSLNKWDDKVQVLPPGDDSILSVEIIVDRPFFFLIRNNIKNYILFAGCIKYL